MTGLRRTIGVVVALASLTAVAALSRVPYRTHDGERALLRLSWRMRGERIEQCRRATPAELANVPQHMRREVICEGARIAAYRLRVVVDGRSLANSIVAGSGVVGDRPIYLLRDFELRPGTHHVQLSFEKEPNQGDDKSDEQPGNSRERDYDRQARRGTVPSRLALDQRVDVQPGSVVLVTYDSERRQLQLLSGR